MVYNNFPNGFNSGLIVRGVPVAPAHARKVYYVGNNSTLFTGEKTASNGNDGSFQRPWSTLNGNLTEYLKPGDYVYIRPGYSQSMTAADDVDVDVEGVTIIGLGRGTKMAKFVYDGASGEFVIGAANVRIENLWFVPSVNIVTKALDVEAAGTNFEIVNCRFADAEAAGTDEFLISIGVAAGATNGKILNNYIDMGTAGAATGITLATSVGCQMYNNVIKGDFSTSNVAFITTAPVAFDGVGNIMINGVVGGLNTEPCIEGLTGGEMNLKDNLFAGDLATLALLVTNWDAGINGGNRYTDDIGGATTAVDRSASIVVSADA